VHWEKLQRLCRGSVQQRVSVGEAVLPLGSGLEASAVWASVVGFGGVDVELAAAAAGSDVGAPHMAS
jgi:hypothetical protein